jgi:CrcB protein
MRLLLLACAGGALGAGARHLVNVGAGRWLGAAFPWSTLIVNIVGCGLMGVLFAALVRIRPETDAPRIFFGTGILGGFTTFSAFTFDVWLMVERREGLAAISYITGSVGLSIAAFVLCLVAARAVMS